MSFYVVQFLTGLASAALLFLVASGLSIIFGVTRIVNFAHGAFYMIGAYFAFELTERLEGPFGFWGGLVIAAFAVAVLGALLEMTLLRRIYRAPELFQLLATFGVTLVVQDLIILIFGPEDRVGRRAPGFKGAVELLGQAVPSYDIFLIILGPAVLGLLFLLFKTTRWGILVRAATQDRDMVAALGVNQKWLFTSVFALGVFLAGLAGALQVPRAVSHEMDLSVIVEIFVVVVIGGLGSTVGAFIAAVIVSELNAFGILVFPKISLILVFLVMALVLVIRPYGLLGRKEEAARTAPGLSIRPWAPMAPWERIVVAIGLALAACLPFLSGNYILSVATEVAIYALFAASLQFMMSVGGLVSFGHAAYFGLGAYGAAFAVKGLHLPFEAALLAGPMLALVGAVVFGWFCVRLSGVYLAMLTMAFAQIIWSIAFQWVEVTGGDNGILGLWPSGWAASGRNFYWLTLVLCSLGILVLRLMSFSPYGYALRATRDNLLRAEAIGLARGKIQWVAFILSGLFAGVAGSLFAFLKGSVFPQNLAIPTSVDALVMVLLGGVETVSGAVAGGIVFKALSIVLMSKTDYSRLVLGLVIVGLVVAFPKGLAGTYAEIKARLTKEPVR